MFLADQIKLPEKARWLPFDPAIASQIEPDITESQQEIIKLKSSHGPSAMLEVDGQILFAVGMFKMSKDYVEVWALINPKLKHKYPIMLTRKVKQLLDIYAISEDLRYVFMFVESARDGAMGWAYSLGFYESGRIEIYANPGSNVFIFRKDF
jgi:hypothetical protein